MAQKKGCCFVGCIGAVIVFILAFVAMGLGAKWGFRKLMAWTDTAPMTLPAASLDPEQFNALTNRVAQFALGMSDPSTRHQLTLTPQEINVLLTNLPSDNMLSRNFRVHISSNNLYASAALSLDEVATPLKGRFLNLQARLEPTIENGHLAVRIADILIRGKKPPADITAQITKQNLAAGLRDTPAMAQAITNIQTVVVTNNTLVITSR